MGKITERADRIVNKVFRQPITPQAEKTEAGKVLGDFLAEIRSKRDAAAQVKKGVM